MSLVSLVSRVSSASLAVRELTPPGSGGVAVLELRGAGTGAAVARLTGEPRFERDPGRPAGPSLVRLFAAGAGGELLDEALLVRLGPAHAELHVHGSAPLVRRILGELAGSEPTVPELGAPVDLEARAWRALPAAACEAAARILLDQAEGALRRELEQVSRLADEGEARARLRVLAERGRVAAHVLRPRTVVLAGPVNAGKSTLFNLLVASERVVVSAEPGTTRDVIQESARLGAYPIRLFDTAGERELEAVARPEVDLERRGQDRGRGARRGADLVLWLQPGASGGAGPLEVGALRVLTSRADELSPEARAEAPRPIAARTWPEPARERVEALFREHFGLPVQPWTPGAGVPFEPALTDAIAHRARGERGGEALEAWLT